MVPFQPLPKVCTAMCCRRFRATWTQPAFLKATLTRKPEAEEIPVQVNIQYVVEFYAR